MQLLTKELEDFEMSTSNSRRDTAVEQLPTEKIKALRISNNKEKPAVRMSDNKELERSDNKEKFAGSDIKEKLAGSDIKEKHAVRMSDSK